MEWALAFSGFAFSLVGVLKYRVLLAHDHERRTTIGDSGPAVPTGPCARQRVGSVGHVDGRALGA